MTHQSGRGVAVLGVIVLCALVSLTTWLLTKPADPVGEAETPLSEQASSDAELIHLLLSENPADRRFAFPSIVRATAAKSVIGLDPDRESHQRVIAALRQVLDESIHELSQPESPIRKLRRINEGSPLF